MRGSGSGPSGPLTVRGSHGPVALGFLFAVGALTAYWLGSLLLSIGGLLILVVVALFLAAGLNPSVEFFVKHGVKRPWSLLIVISVVVVALVLFFVALVPVISDQVATIVSHAPGWLDRLQRNERVQELDDEYHIISKAKEFIQSGDWASGLFGGVVGVGLAVLGFFANAFIVTVLTLYFLASFARTKEKLYELAPASKRAKVTNLGDRIVASIGGYVSGAFIVAMCAGITSLIFLLIVGLAEYAVALAAVVALLDVIPMIGATIGAVVVTAIGFATDPKIGIACLVFYVLYQQVENYLIYPRVMQRSVDVPGAVIVIAAMIGAGLLGVIGALLAIPTAAAILLLVRELWLPRQDAR
ncbi:MAG TPA: AI-2E family transporter [Marmoricola sp.]|nr:AI-2E family transporter [Marmoricola sp.]